MTATAPQLGNTGWYLVGKHTAGGGCDHCGRPLANCYVVADSDAKEMTLGRGCVKKVTGWTLTAAKAEQMLQMIEDDERRAANWGAFTARHPDLAARLDADCDAMIPAAHYARHDIREGDTSGEWNRARAESYLRDADAR